MCITGPDSQKCLLPLVWWWWVFKGRKIDKIGFQDFHPPPPSFASSQLLQGRQGRAWVFFNFCNPGAARRLGVQHAQ